MASALLGIQSLPGGVLHRYVEQREERGEGRLQGLIEGEALAGPLLSNTSSVVTGLDPTIGLEQVDDGQVSCCLAIGDRVTREEEPARDAMGLRELPEEPGLAHAGLADDRHHLTMATAGAVQGLAELVQLAVTPHKAGEPAGCGGLQTSAYRPSPQQLV